MKYFFCSDEDFFEPRTIELLRKLPSGRNNFLDAGLRHPADIYNTSSSEVWKTIDALLTQKSLITDECLYLSSKGNDWQTNLALAIDHVLDAVAQHIEACESIVYHVARGNSEKDAVKKRRQFCHAIEPYRGHVNKIVNYIKHRHCPLRILHFHTIGFFTPGYFLEGPINEEMIGPNPDIHSGANVAISLNRDIPYHIIHMFFLARALHSALNKQIEQSSFTQPPKPQRNHLVSRVLKATSLLPLQFFPDELSKPVPLVKYTQDTVNPEIGKVLLEFPSRRVKVQSLPHPAEISCSVDFSEHSRKYKLPYFGNDTRS
ncbi:hypothetical protein [Candidatus Thiodictyon syntrophicum]|uniref:hypothetical protein n=1 Tax=Candidatus Thiodictyon syntrophicum TaxID=1166950 RepID=UPI0012FD29AD|nr:hypothetical protein [Candidatus Thiodictyon syntrophicum]